MHAYYAKLDCTNGSIRLVGGSNKYEGRVEVCVNNNWGTVCHNYWGIADAQVVCTQLGYPKGNAIAFRRAYFGRGSGSIHMNNVACVGTEYSLFNCSYITITYWCSHYGDAGVRCRGKLIK